VTITLYISKDSGALALGAEKVAKAVRAEIDGRGIEARIVRNGSRGLYWLEPMVEVSRPRPAVSPTAR
jgi:formate dehydrogenase iron-sulfur subunit